MMRSKIVGLNALRLMVALFMVYGSAGAAPASPALAAAKKQIVTVWFNAGVGNALKAMEINIQDFQKDQDTYQVEMTLVPEGGYTDRILAAGKTGDLPCLLFFDGPMVSNLAWLGYLQPIDRFVSKKLRSDFLPSIIDQGTYSGKLYTLGIYDSGLAIYGNRKHLQAAGVRIPTVEQPWSLAEFEGALEKLAAVPGVEYPLDMKINYGRGEFFTFGFSPILQSFGGDLIDRRTFQTAQGVLNGPQSVAAMKRFQSWFQKGWANPKPPGDTDFPSGKAALSWAGHWIYGKYADALGNDLVVIPMPDFGKGPKTGLGTWNFGISSSCRDPAGSWALLEYILRPDKIGRWTGMHPGVPARKSALASSKLYGPGGPLNIYVQQIEKGWAVPRPPTPAYAAITKAFAEAVDNIIQGADVQSELTKAATKIDQDIQTHNGYPAR